MGEVGALPHGGCCRAALSVETRPAATCSCAGVARRVAIAVDQVGNIYARRRGRAATTSGRHRQPPGHAAARRQVRRHLWRAGRLEVVRALNDAHVETGAPIDVIVWTNEEGVRFSPPLAGSSAFAGLPTSRRSMPPHARWHDRAPGSRVDGLSRQGTSGRARARLLCRGAHRAGPDPRGRGHTIGIVTQIQGIRWLRVTVTGMDAHAGTTPMNRRRDALLGAAEMVTSSTGSRASRTSSRA